MADEYYNSNASCEFENKVHDELIAKLEEVREDLLFNYGFYFNYEDVYLRHPDEMIIDIY